MIILFSLLLSLSLSNQGPFQILYPSTNHEDVLLNLDIFKKLDLPSSSPFVISIVGPYHSGKSFFMNQISKKIAKSCTDIEPQNPFKIGPQLGPETKGSWLYPVKYCVNDRHRYIYLIDTEGFFGPKIKMDYDSKVFSMAVLLSDLVIVNTVKIIDQSIIDRIDMTLAQTQIFSDKLVFMKSNENLIQNTLPQFAWAIQDFISTEEGVDDWWNSFNREKLNSLIFSTNMSLFPFAIPTESMRKLSDLSKIARRDLSDDYIDNVENFYKFIIYSEESAESRYETSSAFWSRLNSLSRSINSPSIYPELPSLLSVWAKEYHENLMNDTVTLWEDYICNVELISGIEYEQFVMEHLEITLAFYNKLNANLNENGNSSSSEDTSGEMSKLLLNVLDKCYRKRVVQLRTHFENQTQIHLDTLKSSISKRIVLPQLPRNLSITINNIVSIEMEKLNEKIKPHILYSDTIYNNGIQSTIFNFLETRRFSKLVFKTDSFEFCPISKYESESRVIIDDVINQNELKIESMTISQFEKTSVKIHDFFDFYLNRNVIGEGKIDFSKLHVNKQISHLISDTGYILYSTESLNNVLENFQREKLQEFSDGVPQFFLGLDVYEVYFNKLKTSLVDGGQRAIHENKVNIHSVFTALSDAYTIRAKLLVHRLIETHLPLPEEEIDSTLLKIQEDHMRLDGDLGFVGVDLLKNHESYTNFLTYAKEKVWQTLINRIQSKNVEIWKLHSDEITQCTQSMNNRYVSENCGGGSSGILSIFSCMFNFWPNAHYTRSKLHFTTCADLHEKSSSGGSSYGFIMPTTLRDKVFESWYSSELLDEAYGVKNRLISLVFVIVFPLVVLIIVWYLANRRSNEYNVQFTPSPSFKQGESKGANFVYTSPARW